MEAEGGAEGVDEDVGEGAGVKAFGLDVVAEGSEVAIECAKLRSGALVVGVVRGRNRHFHLGSCNGVGSRVHGLGSAEEEIEVQRAFIFLCDERERERDCGKWQLLS